MKNSCQYNVKDSLGIQHQPNVCIRRMHSVPHCFQVVMPFFRHCTKMVVRKHASFVASAYFSVIVQCPVAISTLPDHSCWYYLFLTVKSVLLNQPIFSSEEVGQSKMTFGASSLQILRQHVDKSHHHKLLQYFVTVFQEQLEHIYKLLYSLNLLVFSHNMNCILTQFFFFSMISSQKKILR